MERVNLKYLLVGLILILSLGLGMGCIFFEPPASPSPPPPDITAPVNPDWKLPPVDGQSLPIPDFISAVAKVKASVVVINTETEVVTYDFFNRPYTKKGKRVGSGWIIDEVGYLVTNNHVVEDAQSIAVILDDGRTFLASIVGADPHTDIAVIKIYADNLVKADIGDSSQLNIGEWVLAVGNSLDLGVTPSQGIVRSLGATIPVSAGQSLYGLIGTSAAINPGDSGGPLVNLHGEVVGITTIKISMVGIEAMGWAVSGEVAMPVIEELIKSGYVVRPWLGVAVRTVDQVQALANNLAVDEGAFVAEVVPGSPADKAGLKVGDVIVHFGGDAITTRQGLGQAVRASGIGKTVEIIFWRGEVQKTTSTILIEIPVS